MTHAHDLGDTPPLGPTPAQAATIGDEGATEIVYDWNLQTDEIAWNGNYDVVPGLPPLPFVETGLSYAEHLAAESQSSRYEAIMVPGGCDTGGGVPFTTIYGLVAARRSQLPPVWVEDSGRWFADINGRPCRAHGAIRIITERYEADRARTAAAQRDPATGAFTRAHFIDHVSRRLGLAGRKTGTFAIILIEVERADGTDVVGDAEMLEGMGLLRAQMRSNEMLARYAANKFAALLDSCDEPRSAAAADRLIAAVGEAPGPMRLVARIGGVIAPGQGRTPQALLQFAEEALDASKGPEASPDTLADTEAGGTADEAVRPAAQPVPPSRYMLYRPELTMMRAQKLDAADEFMAALDDNRVMLALQPVVDASTRAVAFYEGLVRVRRLNGVLIYPDALVALAERRGLVALLDRRVIELAFALLTSDRKLRMSINAAAPSLADPLWLDQLRSACRRRPDAARRLIIEVTETCVIADLDATTAALAGIKALGPRIAIDDFGSGHSSFRNLRQLPIDFLKIDGAFAQNLANSQDDRFFIRTLIDLARNLGIPTVVEWVGDEATADILTGWGVGYLQGHLFGKAELATIPTAPVARAGSLARAQGR